MTLTARIILILMLILPLMTGPLAAQPAQTSAATLTDATEEPVETPGHSSEETRRQFNSLLNRHPPELGTILALDPTLLSNDAFLGGYPELAKFVKDHPEVRRNPRFYLEQFTPSPRRENQMLEDVLQGIFILCIMGLFAFVITWLIRTAIEQRRWSRLSKTQSEVHNKILDRFGTSTELLEYMRSPAGTKFLESAPIPLRLEPAPQNAPLARMLWSIQIGIIVSAAAIGTLMISHRFGPGSGLFAIGIIGLSVGVGFIGSAVVSMFVSRRLGVWQPPQNAELGDSGLVR